MFDRLFPKKQSPPKAQKRVRNPPTVKQQPKPYKLNDKRQKTICDCIALGMSYTGAAYRAGISRQTFYNWREQIPEFDEAIKMAESMGEEKALKTGFKSATFAWNWLKSRFPEEYKDKTELEVSGGDTPIRINIEYEELEGYTFEAPLRAAAGDKRSIEIQRGGLREEMGQDKAGAGQNSSSDVTG